MSEITRKNWKEFIMRIVLFILAVLAYIIDKITDTNIFKIVVHSLIFVFFQFKMIRRLIPQKIESMGNQKIFRKNYIATGINVKRDFRAALIIASIWILINLVFGILYLKEIFDAGIMMIISMFYAVCDLICVLFYCPFQRWIMKNKCCNTCRIYNWDFAMMFTPLVFVPGIYNYSLVLVSLLVLFIWEYNYIVNTNRFHEESNENLKCKNCKEFMCKNNLRKMN